MAQAILYVDGLSSERSAGAVNEALKSLDGVQSVVIDIEQKKARVNFDPIKVQPERMKWAVRQQGFAARPWL